MRSWQLQEAKAKFSEVIETAERHGAQLITRRGVETAVVVPIAQWKRLHEHPRPTLLEILQSGPHFDLPIPPRGKMRHRKPVKFGCICSTQTSSQRPDGPVGTELFYRG